MAFGNEECKRNHIKWIETEWEPPADIGARVIVYPIDGLIDAAEYLGQGLYRVGDYTISGEDFTHWAYCEPPKQVIA